MHTAAGDLGIIMDWGNMNPDAILQVKIDGNWENYLENHGFVRLPIFLESLPPGEYRLHEYQTVIINFG
jgi:hypothetical protein